DLAILELERLPDQARALLLAERPVAVGQRLWVIGNPRGEFGLWTPRAGRVLDLTTDVMKYRSGQEVEARLIRAELPIQAGFSGGPLVNDRGQVVGICTAWREATYCIDIAEVRTFLARALRLRAHRALAAKKFDDAIRDCDESLRHNPDDPQTYNTRGAAYSFQDDYDRAIADYTQAIRLDPNFAVAYRNRGSCWYLKGDDEQAIRDCTRAIRLDATDARAYERRGQAYARRGERDRAEADFAVARRLRAGK
ncbi:MAG: tetratricopeptide repeat protein, partial [Gemmataceae bacterium]|nr:tetratricopeptide repeat protein [Gemmataceae bacterium]MDW8264728.1 tetratricopeptide repeat protein [Gemmataceae bacterium]